MRNFIKNYKHGLYLLYFLVYLVGFSCLEKHVTTRFHVIHASIDDYIPFCEFFIVPYLLWFFFIAAAVIFFFFQKEKREYYQFITFLYIGMTLFLIICALYPNGHYLRPQTFARDNIFVSLVKNLYAIDTSTNVLPSIHVYNTLGAWIAIRKSKRLASKRWLQIGTSIFSITIILSTVFLKQHSIVDVIAAFILADFAYFLLYVPKRIRHAATSRKTEAFIKL